MQLNTNIMIKNLEIVILKRNKIYEAESFNSEFSAVAYYYLLKIKKISIPQCSYIKVWIKNDKIKSEKVFELLDGILFIQLSIDFTQYLNLSYEHKCKFQYELLSSILTETFSIYKIEALILNSINEELAVNNWQMKYEFLRKKILKGLEFRLVIYMDIDAFTFVGEVLQNGDKEEIFIFKSISTFFAVEYLFKGYRFFDKKVRIGSKEKAVFELDLNTHSVKIVDENNKMLKKLSYNTIQ